MEVEVKIKEVTLGTTDWKEHRECPISRIWLPGCMHMQKLIQLNT